ncbi:hypothetical protein [Mycobacterium paragordonae]|uniref:hypothetical protein n=1 Tax=Mycobacterium paragordonae TaxID=1389713 RepID=UPI0010616ABD|nr:hypothetical protein [Mycobacterium paragordonae]TDK98143.1 hypothetical protein EUA05_31470 [Mycobacterium paragordonae]
MTLDAPLNAQQIDVLRWISDGRPADRWTNFAYKTTTSALEWRGLISVSKRGGVWTAAILHAGIHYLATGNYPTEHRLQRIRPPRPPVTTSAVAPRRALQPSAPAAVKLTYQLVKYIADAGGVLARNHGSDHFTSPMASLCPTRDPVVTNSKDEPLAQAEWLQ